MLFLCLPHGEASKQIEKYAGLAGKIIDLSADFRLKDRAAYRTWYGEEHAAPQWLDRFVYGPSSWTEFLNLIGVEELLDSARAGRSIYDA